MRGVQKITKVKRLGLGKDEEILLNSSDGDVSFGITWYSDKERKNKISNTVLGNTVYYTIVCNGIPENTQLKLRMFDTDEPIGNTNLNKYQIGTVRNRKIENSIFFGIDYYKFIDKDIGDEIEIYWKIDYNGKTYDIFNSILNLQDDEYYRAIAIAKKGKDYPDYLYTCNCGWIDTRHAFEKTKRTAKEIGADNLWNQFKNPEDCLQSVLGNGFQVIYRQDASIFGITEIGVTKKYFVKNGLELKIRERIAMTIFQEVSMEFERLQKLGVAIGKGDSAFEPADLVSNILGLYSVLRPRLTKKYIIENLCKNVGIENSLKIYKKTPGTFTLSEYKNEKFTPHFFDKEKEFCKNPVFPKEFQEIIPFPKDDDNFRDWIDSLDGYYDPPPISYP